MKFVSFKKYKEYLESFGYVQEKGTNEYYNLGFTTYFFSKCIFPGVLFVLPQICFQKEILLAIFQTF